MQRVFVLTVCSYLWKPGNSLKLVCKEAVIAENYDSVGPTYTALQSHYCSGRNRSTDLPMPFTSFPLFTLCCSMLYAFCWCEREREEGGGGCSRLWSNHTLAYNLYITFKEFFSCANIELSISHSNCQTFFSSLQYYHYI